MTNEEKLAQVQKTLDSLPANCKKAFILVRYEGLSDQQAAEAMHIRRWRVRRFVRRAFAACQRAMHPEMA